MAKRARQERRSTRNQWVPSGIGRTGAEDITPKPPSKSGDTDEWLAIPRPRTPGTGGNGGVPGNGHAPAIEDEAAAEPEPRPLKRRRMPKRASARERWLINRLRRTKQRVEDQQEEIARLRAELKELRSGEGQTTSKAKPEPGPGTRPAPKSATRTKAKPARGSRAGRVDLQKATFEELRELGLSVTQSARLIAYRDTGPGFDSVDDLNAIPGFAEATIGKLRERARVDSP